MDICYQDNIAGLTLEKDVMFFCFDVMEDQAETVALTCPRVSHEDLVSISKCCPSGEMLRTDALGGSTECKKCNTSWKIPLNGQLYDSIQLLNQQKLVYDNRTDVSLVFTSRIGRLMTVKLCKVSHF